MCRHKRHGIVTNQNPDRPWDRGRAHASITVCNREECINKALRWAAGQTNETAAYYSDAERRPGRLA